MALYRMSHLLQKGPRTAGHIRLHYHKEQTPTYMYCLPAVIEDLSGSTAVTIFNQPATSMIGITCTDMVTKYEHSNPNIIPPEIETINGKTKVFQLQQPQKTAKGDVRFSTNRVFESTIVIGTPPTAIIGTPSSHSAVTTGQAPETPATTEQQHATAKRQLFQTPGKNHSCQRREAHRHRLWPRREAQKKMRD